MGLCAELPGEAKFDFPQDVQAGVVGPHTGEDMHHVAEVSLHGALLDDKSVFHQYFHVDAVRKHMEVWDGVRDPG